ncbi:unnamed protein product [Schistosoma mattheei]|uniref:Uncharacterized protein n=1 Tax=Schistosoma mattheei TaxID=31246 RepID=A0A183NSL2_9TREM|nr:unnamed protein product [Schistosoma mattheei]
MVLEDALAQPASKLIRFGRNQGSLLNLVFTCEIEDNACPNVLPLSTSSDHAVFHSRLWLAILYAIRIDPDQMCEMQT